MTTFRLSALCATFVLVAGAAGLAQARSTDPTTAVDDTVVARQNRGQKPERVHRPEKAEKPEKAERPEKVGTLPAAELLARAESHHGGRHRPAGKRGA